MIKKIGFNFTIIMIIASSTILQGMQSAQSGQNGSHVLELVILNNHLSFNHDDICSFALVNKESKKAIQKTAKERKNPFK